MPGNDSLSILMYRSYLVSESFEGIDACPFNYALSELAPFQLNLISRRVSLHAALIVGYALRISCPLTNSTFSSASGADSHLLYT